MTIPKDGSFEVSLASRCGSRRVLGWPTRLDHQHVPIGKDIYGAWMTEAGGEGVNL